MRIFYIILIVLSVLVFSSCSSDKDDDGEFPEIPDNSVWTWQDLGINKRVELCYLEETDSLNINIFVYAEEFDISLKFAEFEINSEEFSVNYISNHYEANLTLFAEHLEMGAVYDYDIRLNDINYQGVIQLPAEMLVIFPYYLHYDEDFDLSWEIDDDPDLFLCSLNLYDFNNLEESRYLNWNLKSCDREFTISKAKFDLILYERIAMYLFAFNYDRQDDWLLMTSTGSGRLWQKDKNGVNVSDPNTTAKVGNYSHIHY